MATPQQRRQFERQKRELTQKTQQLNRDLEKLRQGQLALQRDTRALETEKREWKNKKAKQRNELNRPQASPATSPRRGGGGGGGDAVTNRKLQKLQQELERLKREMGDKNTQLRALRTQNKQLARDLRVLKKQLAGKTGKVQIVDHTHITKAMIARLKRDLKIARKKIHKLLNSIRVRKRYYGKHVNKFKRGENRYIRERAAILKRDKVVVKYLFADRVNKVKLSRGKRDRVTLVTEDGEVVIRPVQVVVVPEGGAGDIDDPDEILRELGDIDLDDEDMELPPDDEDDDEDEDEDEDAKLDDAELEAELEAMLNDPEFAAEDGFDDDDDPVYGADNSAFPDSGGADVGAGGGDDGDDGAGDDDGKDREDPEDPDATEDDGKATEDSNTDASSDFQGPYQIGDHVMLKDRAGIIRFIGPTPKSKGRDMYGIELIDGSVGRHNGTVKGVMYFTCPDKRGIFVKDEEIRRKMRPRDEERVSQQTAAIAQNEQRRLSSDFAKVSGPKGASNLMTFVIQESSRRAKDIDQLKDLLEMDDAQEQNQGFATVMTAYQQRHGDFIATLDALPSQPETDDFDDVRTYNQSFMNFAALLANTMSGKATLKENARHSLEYFLEELTGRISDVHKLQDIHFDRDENPDNLTKEERCQRLFDEILQRHQREEDDLQESTADNAPAIIQDFQENNVQWRGAMMRTKQNQDQLEKLLAEFANRTQHIADDINIWKRLWEAPVPDPQPEEQGAVDEPQPDAEDPDAPPEDSGDEM